MRSIIGILTLLLLLTSCGGGNSTVNTSDEVNEGRPNDSQTQQKNWNDSKWDDFIWQ